MKGVIDHSGQVGEHLICKFHDETNNTIELAIDRVNGSVKMLSGQLVKDARLLLEEGNKQVQLCIEGMRDNAIMVLAQVPRIAGQAAFDAGDGFGEAVRLQLGRAPADPNLLHNISQALKDGNRTPRELVEFVQAIPPQHQDVKYAAYQYLLKFFQVHKELCPRWKLAVQFYISFVALQDQATQTRWEWMRGKRCLEVFTAELVNVPDAPLLRDEVTRLLNGMEGKDQDAITNETYSIMAKLRPPPKFLPLPAPQEAPQGALGGAQAEAPRDPTEVCAEELERIERDMKNAQKEAERLQDQVADDHKVTNIQQTIQRKIHSLKGKHPDELLFENNSDFHSRLGELESKCQKLAPLRSKTFFIGELRRRDRFVVLSQGYRTSIPPIPGSMPVSEFDEYMNLTKPTQVAFESVRFPGKFLDASDDSKVKNTRGSSNSSWAKWKVHTVNHDSNVFAFESVRFPGKLLDASDDSQVKNTRGATNSDWAKWKMVRLEGDTCAFESVRFPGRFLDASDDDQVLNTRGSTSCNWAQWKIVIP
eukprot:Skav205169  [mRNA]  locus=scaffold2773:126999:128710:- [translate_table: standard]